jgi:hypothetical protein
MSLKLPKKEGAFDLKIAKQSTQSGVRNGRKLSKIDTILERRIQINRKFQQ